MLRTQLGTEMALDEGLPPIVEAALLTSTDNQLRDRESSPALPSLPSLPTQIYRAQQQPCPNRPLLTRLSSRKRPFGPNAQISTAADEQSELAAAFNTSSDPAFFSSDETPDLENYSRTSSKRRKKKVYSGTWWGGRLRSRSSISAQLPGDGEGCQDGTTCEDDSDHAKRTKRDREFRRNFDSGIFMADEVDLSSSGFELSSDGAVDEDEIASRSFLNPASKDGMTGVSRPQSGKQSTQTAYSKSIPFKKFAPHDIVPHKPSLVDEQIDRIVHQCLESCNPDIDLTSMGIEELPQSIAELRTLVISSDPQDQTFAPLSCRLRIYLANNSLSLFPGNLLQLTNIEFLSLRQNQLTQLPDAILNLRHLSELNISSNKLETLPFNILKLCDTKLLKVQSEPNPWTPIPPPLERLVQCARLAKNQPSRSIQRVAVAPVVEFGPNGLAKRRKKAQHERTHSTTFPIEPNKATRVPYLSEAVLRQLSRSGIAGTTDLSQCEETQLCPDTIKSTLHILYRTQHEGKRHCTFCDRPLILPRYEWLEWWSIRDFRSDKGEVNPSDAEYEIIKDYEQMNDSENEDNEKEVHSQRKENEAVLPEGQILPFKRFSCGCRSQTEGLEIEYRTWEKLASSAQNANEDRNINKRRTWPVLE